MAAICLDMKRFQRYVIVLWLSIVAVLAPFTFLGIGRTQLNDASNPSIGSQAAVPPCTGVSCVVATIPVGPVPVGVANNPQNLQ